MSKQFDSDKKFESLLLDFVTTFNSQFQNTFNRLITPISVEKNEFNNINFYLGLFAKNIVFHSAKNEDIAYEIGFQLELVYFVHNLRLDCPWNTFGQITKRATALSSERELVVFGNELLARTQGRILSSGVAQLPADTLLKINQLINELALDLTGSRNQLLSGSDISVYPAPLREAFITSLKIANIFEKNETNKELQDFIDILINLRNGSLLNRALKYLSVAKDDKLSLTRNDLLQLGSFDLFSNLSSKLSQFSDLKNSVNFLDLNFVLRNPQLISGIDDFLSEQTMRAHSVASELKNKFISDLAMLIDYS